MPLDPSNDVIIRGWSSAYYPDQDVNSGSAPEFSAVTTNELRIGGAAGTGSFQYSLPSTVASTPGYTLVASATAGETEWASGANPFDQDLNTGNDAEFKSVTAPTFQLATPANPSLPTWYMKDTGFSFTVGEEGTGEDVISILSGGNNPLQFYRGAVDFRPSPSNPGALTTTAAAPTCQHLLYTTGSSGGEATLGFRNASGPRPDMAITRLNQGDSLDFTTVGIGTVARMYESGLFTTVGGAEIENKFELGASGPSRCSFPMDVSASDNGDLLTYNGSGAAEWRAPPRETLWIARGPFTVAASPPPSAVGDLLTGFGLIVQHGSINIPQSLLSANLGAQYTLKLSGWLTTTNTADKFNISFAMQTPGNTFPIVTSKIDFNVLTPAVDIPWESEVRFSVSTASASELLVEGSGCFTYRGDENTSSNHALEGNVLGFPTPADRTAGGVVVALSPPFNINVTLLYNVWFDEVDAAATVTMNKGSLVLDSKMQVDDTKSMEGEALATLNHVTYELEPAVSVATSRSMKEFLASNERHYLDEDNPLHIVVPSGNSFVDLRNSTLSYDIHFEGMGEDSAVYETRIPQGASYLNMWNGFKLTHATGVSITTMNQGLGLWRQINTWWNRSAEWRATIGQMLGMASQHARPFDNVDSRVGDYVNEANQRDLGAKTRSQAIDGSKSIEKTVPHVVLPLPDLFDWADKDELCPPYMMAGLQLDLSSLRKEQFFVRVAKDPKTYVGDESVSLTASRYDFNTYAPDPITEPNYNQHDVVPNAWPVGSRVYIDNVRLNLCAYTLTDSMTDFIAKKSAAEGLQWAWTDCAHTSTTNSDETFTMPVSQALSRANAMIVHASLDSHRNSYYSNHTASLPWIPDEDRATAKRVTDQSPTSAVLDNPTFDIDGTCLAMQARVGAMYLPAQPVRGGVKDFYHSALQCFSGMRRGDQVGPTLGEFAGHMMTAGPTYQTGAASISASDATFVSDADLAANGGFFPAITTASQGLYAIPLETSPDLVQSGIALSAQRTGEISFQFKPMSGKQRMRRYDLFVPHTRVASFFLGDVCVVRN